MMNVPSGTPRPDALTQSCRNLVRTFTYEDIVGCTIFGAPMAFMIGPASIVAQEPVVAMIIQSLIGFVLGWMIHRVGHRLLTALPKEPCGLYITSSRCLPMKLTVAQFIWGMELIVGMSVFAAVVGKRWWHSIDAIWLWGLSLMVAALVLYGVPVYLGRLWIRRYYPTLTLVGPTEEVIKTSLPGIPFLTSFVRKK